MAFDISVPAITRAIYGTILAAYTKSPDAGLPAPCDVAEVHFSYCWPGTALDEAAYLNPWTPASPGGRQAATESISALVDEIPALRSAYTPSGYQVENNYRLILMASPVGAPRASLAKAQPAPAPHLPQRVLIAAPSGPKRFAELAPEALAARELERRYADASANLVANRLQHSPENPADRASWAKVAPRLESEVRKAWQALQAHRTVIGRSATVGVASAAKAASGASNPVASVLSYANELFSSTRLASISVTGMTYHPSCVSPESFADPSSASTWPSVSAIKVATQEGGPPDLSISLKFCRVDIRRPWLLMNLLDMGGWRLEGTPAGGLSSGSATGNTGAFPLLPESFVVARDVEIKEIGDDSGAALYTAKGLQILAWISSITPRMPPNG